MSESVIGLLVSLATLLVFGLYLWFRLGPVRCPKCGRWGYGVWGMARRYVKCRGCDTTYDGPTTPR